MSSPHWEKERLVSGLVVSFRNSCARSSSSAAVVSGIVIFHQDGAEVQGRSLVLLGVNGKGQSSASYPGAGVMRR